VSSGCRVMRNIARVQGDASAQKPPLYTPGQEPAAGRTAAVSRPGFHGDSFGWFPLLDRSIGRFGDPSVVTRPSGIRPAGRATQAARHHPRPRLAGQRQHRRGQAAAAVRALLQDDAQTQHLEIEAGVKSGSDGTRTRDLRRDRLGRVRNDGNQWGLSRIPSGVCLRRASAKFCPSPTATCQRLAKRASLYGRKDVAFPSIRTRSRPRVHPPCGGSGSEPAMPLPIRLALHAAAAASRTSSRGTDAAAPNVSSAMPCRRRISILSSAPPADFLR